VRGAAARVIVHTGGNVVRWHQPCAPGGAVSLRPLAHGEADQRALAGLNGTGPVTVDLGRAQFGCLIFQYMKTIQTCKFKMNALQVCKNIQIWHEASFENGEHLSPLAQLEIPTTAHTIMFGRYLNLNFL
jgi:hypothetical protein